jgi:predicted metal-dependent hydrolase
MRGLLQFTLDLFDFEPKQAVAPVKHAPPAPELVAPGPQLPARHLDDVLAPASFRHPRANRETRLNHALVAYEFKRGKRRTIGFAVGPDGLVVRAPRWAPLHEVESALQEKSAWIIRKLDEVQQRCEQLAVARIEWKDGATFPFLGATVQVVLEPSHAFSGVGAALLPASQGAVDAAHGLRPLHVALPRNASPEQIRDVVQAWLMREAKRIFTERLHHFAPQLQVQWRKLSLSNASTRWGSASSDGSIRLNWRLIHVRQAVIDYVVVHELSHLRVMDHSPRFWDTVRTVVPDYAALRGQLKREAVPRW